LWNHHEIHRRTWSWDYKTLISFFLIRYFD
jgi:hypothetical protein